MALARHCPQSITDKEMERITGEACHGDAAFADYLINLGISYRIKKKAGVLGNSMFQLEEGH